MKNLKKAIAPIAMAAVMLSTSALPASAANNVNVSYSQKYGHYSVTTECRNFKSYVTANAGIEQRCIIVRKSSRGNKGAYVKLTKYCPSSQGSVARRGWASSY